MPLIRAADKAHAGAVADKRGAIERHRNGRNKAESRYGVGAGAVRSIRSIKKSRCLQGNAGEKREKLSEKP